jgi:hypothetical protein
MPTMRYDVIGFAGRRIRVGRSADFVEDLSQLVGFSTDIYIP